ncbi:MAG: class I SAM-dependent methyltransferase [Actinomycetota bacterium]|nr:class I SAM-dependent methyltransferase [Actinomycetota bacterium]
MFGYEKDGVSQFERVARHYDRVFGRSSPNAHRIIVDLVRSEKSATHVLDVGSGTGLLLQTLADEMPQIRRLHGIDPAARMVEVARERLPQAEFVLATAESIPTEASEFDLVVSSESFGHWRDQPEGLREIHRVLKPGGAAVLVEHVPPRGWKRWLFYAAGTLPRYLSLQDMADLGSKSGFLVDESENRDGYTVIVLRKDHGK